MTNIKQAAGDLLVAFLRAIVRGMLHVDRKFWKAYLGIETPLYKLWWAWRAQRNQELLKNQQGGVI